MLNIYQLEQRIDRDLRAHDVPGFALAIVQGQNLTYARGFGATSVEDGATPVTPHTLFAIGSISKSLTGTAIMRLVAQGALDLDAPVTRYVPWLTFDGDGAAADVTLRRLLSHTAGLPSAYTNFGPRDPAALETFIRRDVCGASFIARPGKVHYYSNAGIDLSGYVAEVVTGAYFPDLLRELVFAPLAMDRTTYDRTVAMTYPLALAHERDADGTLRVNHRFTDNTSGNPAGFALSNLLDHANFAVTHLNEGRFRGAHILPPALVAAMHRPHISLYTPSDEAYGLTFFCDQYKGVRRVWHDGILESYVCRLMMIPSRAVAVIALANFAFAPAIVSIVNDIFDHLLDLSAMAPARQSIVPDTLLWPHYAGAYLSLTAGLVTIGVADGRLTLEREGRITNLTPLTEMLYVGDDEGGSVGFIPEDGGATHYIVVDGQPYERVDPATFTAPDPAVLRTYAGTYRFDDGDTTLVCVEGNQLLVTFSWLGAEIRGVPLSVTRFASPHGVITFHPSGDAVPTLAFRDGLIAARVV